MLIEVNEVEGFVTLINLNDVIAPKPQKIPTKIP